MGTRWAVVAAGGSAGVRGSGRAFSRQILLSSAADRTGRSRLLPSPLPPPAEGQPRRLSNPPAASKGRGRKGGSSMEEVRSEGPTPCWTLSVFWSLQRPSQQDRARRHGPPGAPAQRLPGAQVEPSSPVSRSGRRAVTRPSPATFLLIGRGSTSVRLPPQVRPTPSRALCFPDPASPSQPQVHPFLQPSLTQGHAATPVRSDPTPRDLRFLQSERPELPAAESEIFLMCVCFH